MPSNSETSFRHTPSRSSDYAVALAADKLSEALRPIRKAAMIEDLKFERLSVRDTSPDGDIVNGTLLFAMKLSASLPRHTRMIWVPVLVRNGEIKIPETFEDSSGRQRPLTAEGVERLLGTKMTEFRQIKRMPRTPNSYTDRTVLPTMPSRNFFSLASATGARHGEVYQRLHSTMDDLWQVTRDDGMNLRLTPFFPDDTSPDINLTRNQLQRDFRPLEEWEQPFANIAWGDAAVEMGIRPAAAYDGAMWDDQPSGDDDDVRTWNISSDIFEKGEKVYYKGRSGEVIAFDAGRVQVMFAGGKTLWLPESVLRSLDDPYWRAASRMDSEEEEELLLDNWFEHGTRLAVGAALKTGERITGPAMRDEATGEILYEQGMTLHAMLVNKFLGGSAKGWEAGFMTDTGRYLTREEAVAVAVGAEQGASGLEHVGPHHRLDSMELDYWETYGSSGRRTAAETRDEYVAKLTDEYLLGLWSPTMGDPTPEAMWRMRQTLIADWDKTGGDPFFGLASTAGGVVNPDQGGSFDATSGGPTVDEQVQEYEMTQEVATAAMDDSTSRHLDSWLYNEFVNEDEREAAKAAMLAIIEEDPGLIDNENLALNKGWPEILDLAGGYTAFDLLARGKRYVAENRAKVRRKGSPFGIHGWVTNEFQTPDGMRVEVEWSDGTYTTEHNDDLNWLEKAGLPEDGEFEHVDGDLWQRSAEAEFKVGDMVIGQLGKEAEIVNISITGPGGGTATVRFLDTGRYTQYSLENLRIMTNDFNSGELNHAYTPKKYQRRQAYAGESVPQYVQDQHGIQYSVEKHESWFHLSPVYDDSDHGRGLPDTAPIVSRETFEAKYTPIQELGPREWGVTDWYGGRSLLPSASRKIPALANALDGDMTLEVDGEEQNPDDLTGWALYEKTEPTEMVQMDEDFKVDTLEGPMNADAGDYLARGPEGELYPVDEEIQAQTYEEIEG
jgi:hypothetical protein